jgi:signal transduction histidine kinase
MAPRGLDPAARLDGAPDTTVGSGVLPVSRHPPGVPLPAAEQLAGHSAGVDAAAGVTPGAGESAAAWQHPARRRDDPLPPGFDWRAPEAVERRRQPRGLWSHLRRPDGLLHALAGLGPRVRVLLAVALLASLAVLLLARALAATPGLPGVWQAAASGGLTLRGPVASDSLDRLAGRTAISLSGVDGRSLPLDGTLLEASARWQTSDAHRAQALAAQQTLAELLSQGPVELLLADGERVVLTALPRGWAGVSLAFWPLAALALLLVLCGTVAMLVAARAAHGLYLLMATCQAGHLLVIAMQAGGGLGLPAFLLPLDWPLRTAFDLATAAALLHALLLYPTRLPHARTVALLGWAIAAAVWWTLGLGAAPWVDSGAAQSPGTTVGAAWGALQTTTLLLGAAALAAATASRRYEPNPIAAVMQRFAALALALGVLVTLAVSLTDPLPEPPSGIGQLGPLLWHLFLASLLLLVPFLARSRQLLREFALMAGIGTVAASLNLLFVFTLEPVASLALALVVAIVLYVGARGWILRHMIGRAEVGTARTFELLYRASREVQSRPQRQAQALSQLLREVFAPMSLEPCDERPSRSRVRESGAVLVVPLQGQPSAGGMPPAATLATAASPTGALLLRHAQGGSRLFTHEDASLADRMVDQLHRAVTLDSAVERGRTEERQRIAQDLHDDIGARLLTLMYQAPTPEIEDYIRHTLKDLKTLTRGLAAGEYTLADAAAEWKADLQQRVTVAGVVLHWRFDADRDLDLTVVQWSALTRVLRELTSNVLAHAQATQMSVNLRLAGRCLFLHVADDGCGRAPETWTHGLGLGGVRKRVKQLGGRVQWLPNTPRGIVCAVEIDGFGAGSGTSESPAAIRPQAPRRAGRA